MLKRLIWSAFLLISTLLTTHAQNVTVSIGKPYEVIDGGKNYFTNGTDILTVKLDKRTFYLQRLSAADLSLKKVKMYEDFAKDVVIERIASIQDKYYVFYSKKDRDVEQLYAREIDFDACTFKDKGKLILSIKEKIGGGKTIIPFVGVSFADKYSFNYSNDQSVFVIQYRLKPEIKDDDESHDIIGMHVFDKNLTEKWNSRVVMPYTEKKMDNLDYSIDSKGNGYIVAKVYNDDTTRDKKKGSDNVNYHIEILKIMAETGKVVPIKIDLKGNFISELVLFESSKNFMYCAGYYNIGEGANNSNGIISFKLDDQNKINDFKTYEFPLALINQNASKKEKRKNNNDEEEGSAEMANLSLKRVIPQEDGSLILIGEQSFMRSHRTSNGGMYYIYYYNSMVMTKIDPAGKLSWMKKLPKRQRGAKGVGGMSFYYFQGGGDHYLLFLDNEKNMALTENDYPEEHVDEAGGFLTAYKISDKDGAAKKVSILDTRNVKGTEIFQVSPHRIQETLPNTFVFEAYKKKGEDVLVKVEIN